MLRLVTLSIFLISAHYAPAALSLNFSQVGDDVLVQATGTVTVTGLNADSGTGSGNAFVRSDVVQVIASYDSGDDIYRTSKTGSLFTEGFSVKSGISGGDSFGVAFIATNFYLYVPVDFTSGAINGSLTVSNTDLESLGVIAQTITWGAGEDQAVTITATPVPEPAYSATCVAVLGFLLVAWSRRRRS